MIIFSTRLVSGRLEKVAKIQATLYSTTSASKDMKTTSRYISHIEQYNQHNKWHKDDIQVHSSHTVQYNQHFKGHKDDILEHSSHTAQYNQHNKGHEEDIQVHSSHTVQYNKHIKGYEDEIQVHFTHCTVQPAQQMA